MQSTIGTMIFLVLLAQEPAITDAKQFVRLVEAQLAPLKDLGFLYEGNLRWVGPRRIFKGPLDSFEEFYQGVFLYRRNDGAMRDSYRRKIADPASISRYRVACLRGSAERQIIFPSEGARAPIQPYGGGMTSLKGPASPTLLFQPWTLLEFADKHPDEFQHVGWEEVDQVRCLRIRIGALRDPKDDFEEYWIDMSRSGNILKYEARSGGKLMIRVDQVALSRQKTGENSVFWVPVHARSQSFVWNAEFFEKAVVEQLIDVVEGTILLNQGLPDAFFSLKRESGLPGVGELDRLRRYSSTLRLEREFEQRPMSEGVRLDPAGARHDLEKSLIEADKQAKMLEASAPSRVAWSWLGLSQVLAILAGIGLIGTAFVLRKRGI